MLATAMFLVPAAAAGAQATDLVANARRIAVTRSVRETVTPDRATLVLGVETTLADPADASARLATLERAVVDTIRRLGIPASAIGVTPMGVSIVRQPGGFQPGIAQYSAQSVVRVDVDRVDRVASVANAALAKGGVHVNPPTFEVTSEDSLRRVLVQRAIVEARRDAENIARSMGGRLGPVVDVTQNTGPSTNPFPDAVVFPSLVQFSGFSGRQPTSAIVTATVTVRWTFVEGG